MTILVPVKRVIDYNVKPVVKQDGSGVDLDRVKMAMNPFDEIALEEALQIKERGDDDDVLAVSVGSQQSQETLRTALAMGADRAVLVLTEQQPLEPLAVAKILAAVAKRENPNIIILGKQAIDDDCSQTGPMLAALLQLPQATFASEVLFKDKSLHVTREVDGGLQTIAVPTPAVVSVDLRLNEPRYASLPNIMKAKRKPLDVLSPDDLGVNPAPKLSVLNVSEPPKRSAGVKVESVAELIHKLKTEAGVL